MAEVDVIKKRIEESIYTKQSVLQDEEWLSSVLELSNVVIDCLESGHKLLICGNGGSASDALHFAGEIVGRFQRERNPWPAICLNADVVSMTAIANDYGYDEMFGRLLRGQGAEGDVFIGITTSGNSINICRAVEEAKKCGIITAGLLGRDGGKMAGLCDYPVIVKSDVTARIQECHIMIIHILCELIEDKLTR